MKSSFFNLALVGQAAAFPALRGIFAPADSEQMGVMKRGAHYPAHIPKEGGFQFGNVPAFPTGSGTAGHPQPTGTEAGHPYPTGHEGGYPHHPYPTATYTNPDVHTKTGPVAYETTITTTGYTTVCKTSTAFVPTSTPVGTDGTKTIYSTYLDVSYSTYWVPEPTTGYEVIYPEHPAAGDENREGGLAGEGANDAACAAPVTVTVTLPAETVYATVYPAQPTPPSDDSDSGYPAHPDTEYPGHSDSGYPGHESGETHPTPAHPGNGDYPAYPGVPGGDHPSYPGPTGTGEHPQPTATGASYWNHGGQGYPVAPKNAWRALF